MRRFESKILEFLWDKQLVVHVVWKVDHIFLKLKFSERKGQLLFGQSSIHYMLANITKYASSSQLIVRKDEVGSGSGSYYLSRLRVWRQFVPELRLQNSKCIS